MREKAFNVTMSESSTRCCVCSLFDDPNVFLTFQPQVVLDTYKELNKQLVHNGGISASAKGKAEFLSTLSKPVTELRVVVQRVLINLPNSLKEKKTAIKQRLSDSESDGDDEQLITCASCGICVHKCECKYSILSCLFTLAPLALACYGGLPYTCTSQWLCQRCQAGVSHNQDCCLCLLRGGALKRTDGGVGLILCVPLRFQMYILEIYTTRNLLLLKI